MHRNAKLTPAGRRILVDRIASGRPAAHVAAEMGVARKTGYKWWRRWLAEGRGRPAGPIEPAAALSHPRAGSGRAQDRAAATAPQARPHAHRLAAGPGQLHRVSRALPAPPQPPRLARPPDRTGHPTLVRAPLAWKPAPHRRQEAGPHPPRRRLARARPRPRRPWGPQPRRLRLHPLRRRRPLPCRLQRGSGRRARGHRGRVLAARAQLVRRARRQRPGRAHRQRFVLPQRRLRLRLPGRRRPAIAAPAPTGRRPTARSNASTAPSSRSGPTSASTAARRPAPPRLPAGCISTIITAATPPSAATRRSTV